MKGRTHPPLGIGIADPERSGDLCGILDREQLHSSLFRNEAELRRRCAEAPSLEVILLSTDFELDASLFNDVFFPSGTRIFALSSAGARSELPWWTRRAWAIFPAGVPAEFIHLAISAANAASGVNYRALLHNIPMNLYTIDLEGRISFANRYLLDTLGLGAEDVLGKSAYDLYEKDLAEKYRKDDAEVLRTGEPLRTVERNRAADGSPRMVEVIKNPLYDEGGKVTGIEGIFWDVTDSHLLERELRLKTRALDASIHAVAICGEEGEIEYVNPGFIDLVGSSRSEEVLGEPLSRFLNAPDGLRSLMARVKKRGSYIGEMEAVKKNRGTLPVQVLATLIPEDDDGGRHIVLNLINSAHIRREEELRSASRRLSDYASTHDVVEVLQEFLDEAELLTGSRIGFYHFVEDDGKSISLQTWSTNTLQSMCAISDVTRHYPVEKAGVWVDCIRERKAVIHNDFSSLPGRKGLPEGPAPLSRELVVPVFQDDAIVAILGVGNKEEDYTDADVQTVQYFAELAYETILRKRVEEENSRLLREKTMLLSEVHHRIKNNMFTIQSMLALQAQTLGEGGARESLENAVSRISSMKILYEMSLGLLQSALMSLAKVGPYAVASAAPFAHNAVRSDADLGCVGD